MATYPDNYTDDGWIWCYYDVTDTTNATTLLKQNLTDFGSDFIIDGNTVTSATSYTFSSTGEHLVKMQRTGQLRGQTFSGVSALKRIYICDTVTSLGGIVFYNCSNITHIYLPDTITSIGVGEFQNCTSLTTINIENTQITSFPGSSNGVFRGDTSLVEIVLPENLTTIGSNTFYGCSSLASISFPSTLTTIGDNAFIYCSSLSIELNLPNVTSIGSYAFNETKISKVSLPLLSSVSGRLFKKCTNLTSVFLGPGVSSVATEAFMYCSNLVSFTIMTLTPPTYGTNALYGTTKLTGIYVTPSSVDTYKAASGWSGFSTKIYPFWQEAPTAINHLSLGDFRRRIMMGISRQEPDYPDNYVDDGWIWCYYEATSTEEATKLVNSSYVSNFGANFIIDGVEVARTATYTFSTLGEHLVKMQKTGSMSQSAYQSTALKRIYFPSTVTGLNYQLFLSCSLLTHVYLTEYITSIGSGSAFRSCSSLVRVNLEDSGITYLGAGGSSGVFQYDTSLRKINLPTSITAIPTTIFSGCTNLQYVNFEQLTSLASIGNNAFRSCGLKRVKLSSSVTSIGSTSFYGCTKLIEVDFGDTQITDIPGGTSSGFMNCTKLKKVVLPSGLLSIGQNAFSATTSLEEINLPSTITSISSYAFQSSAISNKLNLPNLISLGSRSFKNSKITEIEDLGEITEIPGGNSAGAFWGCSRLLKARLPGTLTAIGQQAFYDCSALHTLIVEAITPPTVGSGAFTGTSSLAHIYVPAESVEDYKTAWSSYASKIEAIPTT